MRRTFFLLIIPWAILCLCIQSITEAREILSADETKLTSPLTSAAMTELACSRHDAGNMRLVVSNYGAWGFGSEDRYDYFTGEHLDIGSEYPKGGNIKHLWHAQYWIGGILGPDTVVSLPWAPGQYFPCSELLPTTLSGLAMEKIEGGTPLSGDFEQPVSHQDIIVRFTDTEVACRDVVDYLRGTPHIPLNVEVTQKSYTWSHDLADDFVLFDVTIRNIGTELIKEMYFSIEAMPTMTVDLADEDNDYAATLNHCIGGFVREAPVIGGCGTVDTSNVMWAADNDGTPFDGEFVDEVFFDPDWGKYSKSATSVYGIFFLDYPEQSEPRPATVSYNWYSSGMYNVWEDPFDPVDPLDPFGPRHREDYRNLETNSFGRPLGDANLYHVMSNGEIDYDLLYTYSISPDDPVWMYPPRDFAELVSTAGAGLSNHVLSVGPFDVPPGASIKIPWVYVCGEHFHTDPLNTANLPYTVDRFYDNLDFSDLFENASWARWVYDNPGYDTDLDDYAGEFTICDNGDTVYTSGDGIPDWRCADAPPAPELWLEPIPNGIRVRFNGTLSETEKDMFSGISDFEGYKIYCGRDERVTSLALIASYDKEDFNKYVLTCNGVDCTYRIRDIPYTLDSLRCLYGLGDDPCQDTIFDPLLYTDLSPYIHPDFPDSIFYFGPEEYNASTLGVENHIDRVYPNEPDPSIYHPDSIPEEAYTSEGLLKYYEYEFELTDLLTTIPYWISVTAFDFGHPELNIKGLESSRTAGIQHTYPGTVSDAAAGSDAKVYVYPNPYRGDVDYRELGFEGRTEEDRPDYRVRAINFANLPAKCKIYIYSLDGDLVRKLDHDIDPSDPSYSHDTWNMITRNTQMVVTGLYYWVVEAEDGSTQIGKLAVIM